MFISFQIFGAFFKKNVQLAIFIRGCVVFCFNFQIVFRRKQSGNTLPRGCAAPRENSYKNLLKINLIRNQVKKKQRKKRKRKKEKRQKFYQDKI